MTTISFWSTFWYKVIKSQMRLKNMKSIDKLVQVLLLVRKSIFSYHARPKNPSVFTQWFSIHFQHFSGGTTNPVRGGGKKQLNRDRHMQAACTAKRGGKAHKTFKKIKQPKNMLCAESTRTKSLKGIQQTKNCLKHRCLLYIIYRNNSGQCQQF